MTQVSPHDPDLPLIHAIGAGDTHALRELYALRGAGILSFLIDRLENWELAEEVLQDVMLKVWHNAATFRGESTVRTWLLTIARRCAVDAHRQRKPPCHPLNENILSGTVNVQAAVEKKLLCDKVAEVFHQLPPKQREVVKLTFYHGLTNAEVADVLGENVGTVKSRLHYARQTMRRLLQIEGIEYA